PPYPIMLRSLFSFLVRASLLGSIIVAATDYTKLAHDSKEGVEELVLATSLQNSITRFSAQKRSSSCPSSEIKATCPPRSVSIRRIYGFVVTAVSRKGSMGMKGSSTA